MFSRRRRQILDGRSDPPTPGAGVLRKINYWWNNTSRGHERVHPIWLCILSSHAQEHAILMHISRLRPLYGNSRLEHRCGTRPTNWVPLPRKNCKKKCFYASILYDLHRRFQTFVQSCALGDADKLRRSQLYFEKICEAVELFEYNVRAPHHTNPTLHPKR